MSEKISLSRILKLSGNYNIKWNRSLISQGEKKISRLCYHSIVAGIRGRNRTSERHVTSRDNSLELFVDMSGLVFAVGKAKGNGSGKSIGLHNISRFEKIFGISRNVRHGINIRSFETYDCR